MVMVLVSLLKLAPIGLPSGRDLPVVPSLIGTPLASVGTSASLNRSSPAIRKSSLRRPSLTDDRACPSGI